MAPPLNQRSRLAWPGLAPRAGWGKAFYLSWLEPGLARLEAVLAAVRQGAAHLPLAAVASLLLATPVLVFWRPSYFFVNDDWRTLALMAGQPLNRYLLQPEGEQWFPAFHLAFYGQVQAFGDRYGWLILVTCLGTGLNAFLFFLFLRSYVSPALALALSLFYAAAGVHVATAPMAFYLCYIFSLAFFLLALLATRRYAQAPSPGWLGLVGLTAGLSVLFHNYTLLALWVLPLYVLLLGEPAGLRRAWPLAGLILALSVSFALAYFKFAGLKAATSINHCLLSNFPLLYFPIHWFAGAWAAPVTFLFYNDRLPFSHPQFALGVAGLGFLLAVIWRWGAPAERRLALWALALNGLPFLAVSLGRCNFGLGQAFSPRYGVFTLLGALLLVGLAWTILARKLPPRPWAQAGLPLGALLVVIFGQFLHTPGIQRLYQDRSHIARITYEYYGEHPPYDLEAREEASRLFLIPDYPFLTEGQILAIRRFLKGLPPDP
jgi:hypothetical protein